MMELRTKLRTAAACAAVLLTFTPVRGSDSPDVLADFRQAAIQQGWLLIKLNNSRATVLLVGTGIEQKLQLRPEYSVYQFASSASGQCLTFSVDQKINSWNDVLKETVFTIGPNGAISSTKGHFATVKGLAVSPDCQSLAVDGLYQEIDPLKQEISSGRAGLFLAHVGPGRDGARLIAETSQDYLGVSDAAFGASWSPNSSLIAFSEHGAIHTFNVVSGEVKFLVAGTNPAWSPDGKWLGYRGSDGAPMLIDLASRKTEPLIIKGGSCLWSLKWSPDSRFAIFTQYDDRAGTVFRVCRLRDRAVASIYHSGAQYTEARFAWVTRSTLATLLASGEVVRRDGQL